MNEPSIQAVHLSRRFGNFQAVNDVSFSVHPGEIFGYLGANGAGKSTTIRMLCGLLAPTDGEARVAGVDVKADPEAVKASIGYMSQKFSLYLDLPVRDNLDFFAGAYGLCGAELVDRADEVLRICDLTEQRNAITGSLPGGMRQRLALGCAIVHRPAVLFLDEPTAGVDPVARRLFWRFIRQLAQEGTTIFVTTHYLDEAEYCGRIGLMIDGRLVALDTPAALKRRYVPGRILLARGQNLMVAGKELRAQSGVLAIEPFGAGLHLQVSGEWNADSIARALTKAGAQGVQVESGEPTLEDVFLAAVARPAQATP